MEKNVMVEGGITEKDKKRLNKLMITERYQRWCQHILALRLGSNSLIGPVLSLGQYIYPYSEYFFFIFFYLEVQYFSVNVSIHDVYIVYSVIIIVLFFLKIF